MPGWNTRREIRSQPFAQYDETGLQKLLTEFESRMRQLNDQYLRLMGEHIADIGRLWPSDVHRLQQIRRMNRNLQQLERRIASTAERGVDEIEALFQQITQEDARMATKILGAPDTVNVSDNPALQQILRARARETAARLSNLSNTTVVSGWYRGAIDEAVSAVQSGTEDYGSAIRRVIREAGQSGLRVAERGQRMVDYESGYYRRLDTAVRMNVLDGVRHLNQSIMEELGRQFGADGVEIDAHMLCAEDHLPYQGGQYSNEEFEEIQDSLQRPFGEWNCRHSWHPIILGVSPRTYTDGELEDMRRYSTEPVTIDGRTKTRYQWSQEMRRTETRIRQLKDTATLARYSGDDRLRGQCQQQIGILNEHYKALSRGAGLKPEYQRTYVSGFRDANGTNNRLTGTGKSGTIQTSGGYNRRRPHRNTGTFATLKEPVTIEHAKLIMRQMGILKKGVTYTVDAQEDLVGAGFFGYTSPDGKTVTFYPDAFTNREQLVKTCGHESIHVEQVEKHGIAENSAELSAREDEATSSEEGFWQDYQKRMKWHE